MDREQALGVVKQNITSPQMLNHMLATETGRAREETRGERHEKQNFFGWHWVTFRFDGGGSLRAGTKNNHYEKRFAHAKRDMVGVDDLQFCSDSSSADDSGNP